MKRPRLELVTVMVWASVAIAAGMFFYRCATAPHTTLPISAEPAPAALPTGLPRSSAGRP